MQLHNCAQITIYLDVFSPIINKIFSKKKTEKYINSFLYFQSEIVHLWV